jgi:hypothetical protein
VVDGGGVADEGLQRHAEYSMRGGPAATYLSQIMLAATGLTYKDRPPAADPTALALICQRLVQAEEAVAILVHNGHGKPGDPINETIAALFTPSKT